MDEVTLTYSLADQNFERTKSLGILNLSVQLANALGHSRELARFTVFSNHSLGSLLKLPAGSDVRYFDNAAGGGFGRMRWDQVACYSAAARTGNKWLLLPKGFASFVRKPPVRLAVYVHDTIHDYYATRFPGCVSKFERFYFERSLAASLRHAEVIFTNSEFTRTEVIRVAKKLNVDEPRVLVAGIGFESPSPSSTQKANRIVVLTGAWPHKRTELAVQWTDRWRTGCEFEGEIHSVGALPASVTIPSCSNWRHHQRLGHVDYDALIRSARTVVYFSEYEGFGMPPVEAILAGACPVFSHLPATREVMRDAGVSFFNESFDSFSSAMNRALQYSPQTIAMWGEELLKRHHWSDVATRIANALTTAAP